jgi:hypothetical protein
MGFIIFVIIIGLVVGAWFLFVQKGGLGMNKVPSELTDVKKFILSNFPYKEEPPVVVNTPLVTATTVPYTAPYLPPVVIKPNEEIHMASHHMQSGQVVADVVPSGTPNTVTLPKTGHVLSLPLLGATYGDAEMWPGYCNRVQAQCGAPGSDYTFKLMYAGDGAFHDTGGFKPDGSNWPITADRYYNPSQYAEGTDPNIYHPINPAVATSVILKDAYENPTVLMKSIPNDFQQAVYLDEKPIHSGFGPAKQYYTLSDGSVSSTPGPKLEEEVVVAQES